MTETIQAINEISTSIDGFEVITDKQTITLGISNGQSCCENWGYFMSQDDFSDFIGATLLDVVIVNDCLDSTKLDGVYEANCMFVNLQTSKGLLQFVAYNSHNGYYSHTATVRSDQLNETEYL